MDRGAWMVRLSVAIRAQEIAFLRFFYDFLPVAIGERASVELEGLGAGNSMVEFKCREVS
jgi:hypothetical protein